MMFQLTPYVVLYGVTTAILGLLLLYTWRRREAPGGFYFALLMLAAAEWTLCNTLEMAAVDAQLKIAFARLCYVGVVAFSPLWLLFSLSYAQRSRRVSLRITALAWLVPLGVLGLVFTNDWHHLIWTTITPSSDAPGAVLIYAHGPGVWVNLAYTGALMLAGTFLLVTASLRTYKQFYMQALMLILAAMITPAVNLVYMLSLSDLPGLDLTPIAICLTGLIVAWNMFRYRLFDLVPVARESVIASMSDGVVVIDDQDRILDANAAARLLLSEAALGAPIGRALAGWPELLARFRSTGLEQAEVRREGPEGTRWFDAQFSPLQDNMGMQTGRILILRDITRRKADELALEETRNSLRTLFDSVDDLIYVIRDDGKVLDVNRAVAERLDYSPVEPGGREPGAVRNVLGDYDVHTAVDEVLAGRKYPGPSALQARDGTAVRVETRMAQGLWGGRRAIFGISRDVTELVRQQEELSKMRESLRREVEERRKAEGQIQLSLREKEVLLKEIHHRVKNNMQIISSLLSLQKSWEKDPEVAETIGESQNRIISMALAHEKLYGSGDLARVDFADYAASLVAYLVRSCSKNPGIRTVIGIDKVELDADLAIPCGLIINELVSNSLKYAFGDGSPGEIRVDLTLEGDRYLLKVSDTGSGLPEGFDFRNAPSLGLQLVGTLVDQLEGTLELGQGPGTAFTIAFRAREAGPRGAP